jgi:hypothetical protein
MMRAVLLALALVCFVGCNNDGLTGSTTVNGKYTLRTVNGSALPYTISGSGTNKTEVIDDAITLFEGFTYSRSAHSRVTVNGQASEVTTTDAGSYSIFGTSITLTPGNGGTATLVLVSGNTMTLSTTGYIYVFRK